MGGKGKRREGKGGQEKDGEGRGKEERRRSK